MSRGLSFEDAVFVTVNTMGLGVIDEPTKFVASLMDLCDESLSELRVAERNCDAEFLSVFSAAVKGGTIETLRDASLRGQAILCNQRLIDDEMATRVCEGISRGLERFLFPRKQMTSIAQPDTKATRPDNAAQGNSSSEQTQQVQLKTTTKSHKKGRGIIITIVIIIAFSLLGRIAGRYTAESMLESVGTSNRSSESVIREGVQGELDKLNSGVFPDLGVWLSQNEEAAQQLSRLGIEPEELFSTMFEGFNAQIVDIDINGNTAVVHITVSHKDTSNLKTELDEALVEAMASGEVSSAMTEDEVMKWYGATFISRIKAAPLTQSESEILLYEEGNAWSVDDEKWQDEIARLFAVDAYGAVSNNAE